ELVWRVDDDRDREPRVAPRAEAQPGTAAGGEVENERCVREATAEPAEEAGRGDVDRLRRDSRPLELRDGREPADGEAVELRGVVAPEGAVADPGDRERVRHRPELHDLGLHLRRARHQLHVPQSAPLPDPAPERTSGSGLIPVAATFSWPSC